MSSDLLAKLGLENQLNETLWISLGLMPRLQLDNQPRGTFCMRVGSLPVSPSVISLFFNHFNNLLSTVKIENK